MDMRCPKGPRNKCDEHVFGNWVRLGRRQTLIVQLACNTIKRRRPHFVVASITYRDFGLTGGNVGIIGTGTESRSETGLIGWGGRDRTFECWNQNPVPYHLATPQQAGGRLRRGPV